MSESEKYWRGKAKQFAAEHNFAWWLQTFLVGNFFICCALSILLVVKRRYAMDLPHLWWGLGLALLVMGVWGYWRTRQKYIHEQSALIHLDEANHLYNRLSSALAGVGKWPAPLSKVKKSFRWNVRLISTTLVVSLALPFLAAWIPVGQAFSPVPAPTTPPASWAQVDEWLDELKEAQVVQPEALQQFESQLEQLKKQDPRDWYSHNSLEAGDNLRNRMDQSMSSLERNLQSAQDALGTLSDNKDHLNQTQMEELSSALNQSLDGLKMGNMPLNKELADKLSKMDPSSAKQISPEKMKQLQQALKSAQSKTKSILGNKGQSAELQYDAEASKGQGNGRGKDGNGDQPGQGGVNRGRGDAPLTLGEEKSQVDINQSENLTNDDMRNAALGDSLGVSTGEHKIDKNQALQNQSAGAIGSTGDGGEAVWRYQYRPEEEETLRKFYQ
ncbi:MAG: hypothetical protein SGI98_06135 [Verrucomicrobiota bacterium]|nr:hypothetical protein [Verrucomicrobiota bacterium]